MLPLERSKRPQVISGQFALPLGFVQDLLHHQGVDVNQADLKQVQTEHLHLLVLEPIAGKLAPFAVQDEVVGTVPSKGDIQPFVNLLAKWLEPQVVT